MSKFYGMCYYLQWRGSSCKLREMEGVSCEVEGVCMYEVEEV